VKLLSLIGYDDLAKRIVKDLTSIRTADNNKGGQDPRAIAIIGEWGIGKSYLLELVRKELQTDIKNEFKVIDYDPWKMAGNKNNELGILREILSEYGDLIDKINKFLINSNSTLVEISGKGLILAILVPLIIGFIRYFYPYIKNFIETGVLSLKNPPEAIIFFCLFIIIILATFRIITLFYIKPDFKTIKGYIRKNTIIFIDNIDRCTPEEVFDVFRTVDIYNKVSHLTKKVLLIVCVFNKSQVKASLKKVFDYEQESYFEKLFVHTYNLGPKKAEYFIEKFKEELIQKEMSIENSTYLDELHTVLARSQEILGNYREINTKITTFLEFAVENNVDPILLLLTLVLNSPFSPSVIIFDNILTNEGCDLTKGIEPEAFNTYVNTFFKKTLADLELKQPGSTNHMYGNSQNIGESPKKIHQIFNKIINDKKTDLDFFKLKTAILKYYFERQLEKPLWKFFKKHLEEEPS
jgi:hypothetical protein